MMSEMGEFWDARATENAMFFVDNRLDYSNTDAERFWSEGATDLNTILGDLGVEIAPDQVVVDLGCGIGRATRPLAARASRVIALDVSANMLEQGRAANAELDNVTWVHGDGTTLTGVEDASVDGVYSFVVLQHVPTPEIVFDYVREMGRVLRPGGWCAFQVSNDPSVHEPRIGRVTKAKALVGKAPKGLTHPAWLGTWVDPADLRATLDEAGLRAHTVLNEGTQFCLVHGVKEVR
jgi:ubiquinone/menaquinone biosynthesis C-methylase UbiE